MAGTRTTIVITASTTSRVGDALARAATNDVSLDSTDVKAARKQLVRHIVRAMLDKAMQDRAESIPESEGDFKNALNDAAAKAIDFATRAARIDAKLVGLVVSGDEGVTPGEDLLVEREGVVGMRKA